MSQVIVGTKWGKLLARDNDSYVGASLLHYGEYSAGEQKFFSTVLRPGDVAVDVGANIGAHTACMASLVGKSGLVYAFEPQRIQFQSLCAAVALNDFRNVMAVNAPVSALSGSRIMIPDNDPDQPTNSGAMSLVEPCEKGIPLATVTIDDYRMPACRLIKVDVEGLEMAVLDGAIGTIRKHMPVLVVEANSEPEAWALHDRLEPMGYRTFMHFVPLFRCENPKRNTRNIWGMTCNSINMVALPPWWDAPVPSKFRPIVEQNRGVLFLEQLPKAVA